MSALDAVNLWSHPICDPFDAETLRKIRNECREFMTGDIKPISESGQRAWFDAYLDYGPRQIEVWLILKKDGPPQSYPIGFLSLRYYHETTPKGHPHRTWDRGKADGGRNQAIITLGLTESERGKGYGTAIYRYAREVAGCEVRAEVQATNLRSLRSAKKAGYIEMIGNPGADLILLIADPMGVRP